MGDETDYSGEPTDERATEAPEADRRTTEAPEADRRTTEAPELDDRFPVPLRGVAVDGETRCAHWDSAVDVVALRFGCCETFSPCNRCHAETTAHEPEVWPQDRFDEPAVLCGVCATTLTAEAYLDCGDTCPHCGTAFNPGCRKHRDRYFDVEAVD